MATIEMRDWREMNGSGNRLSCTAYCIPYFVRRCIHVMQTFDVLTPVPLETVKPDGLNTKTGADTARKGHSFLEIMQKMIDGAMDGTDNFLREQTVNKAGQEAGDSDVPEGQGLSRARKKKLSLLKATDRQAVVASDAGKIDERATVQQMTDIKQTEHSGFRQKPKLFPVSDIQEAEMPGGDDQPLAGTELSSEIPEDILSLSPVISGHIPDVQGKQGDQDLLSPETESNAALAVPAAAGEPTGLNVSLPAGQGGVEKGGSSLRERVIRIRDERGANNASPDNASDTVALKPSIASGSDESASSVADMSLSFRPDTQANREGSLFASGDNRNAGQSFASMLSQEIRSSASDLVKTGHIVLRENNQGLIRLTLNPESLGNVRIALELSDGKISGRIHVSSREAYEAFNENLDGLSKAFVESGFESAGFDLSWSGEGNSRWAREEQSGKLSSPFYASSIPDIMSGTESSDTVHVGSVSFGRTALNVYA